MNTNDKLMLFANINALQSNQRVKVYLQDSVSGHSITMLDTNSYSITSNDHNQYITTTTYDGDPIVDNPLYLGAYKINVTLTNLHQNDFIMFDLTKTVWKRENKQWIDTGEIYTEQYGSISYPTKITHVNDKYIGAYDDPSELPETANIADFAYVFVYVYVYTETGWLNVGYISALEDVYPRYTEITNPHYRGNGVVKVQKLNGEPADFSNVYVNQFMDLNLNDTEFVYSNSGWIDSTDPIGTTPHNVDSHYQLWVEFSGSNVTAGNPVILNSLCIQKTTSKPVYTTKNFKDIFSWNKNVFENNHLEITGTGNTEIKTINYVIKPNIEYTIGFNYNNSYASGRIRFKFVTSDGLYTATDWMTLGTTNVGSGKIALGVIKLIAPASDSRFVIEPDSSFAGEIDDLKVVVSNYLTIAQNITSQSWQTISDSALPVYNNYWIIKDNVLQTNGAIPAYDEYTNKQSAVVCYLDSITYNNNVKISMTIDELSGTIKIIPGDGNTSGGQTFTNTTGNKEFNLNLSESASIMIVTSGTGTTAKISKFEVRTIAGTIQLMQIEGYSEQDIAQSTAATTFIVNGNNVGSDIKAQQDKYVELFRNDGDSAYEGTFIKGFYNHRTKQIEAIDWRQDGYLISDALKSYIYNARQTLNNTLLNQIFFDSEKNLYISTDKIVINENQPELKEKQVWYDIIHKKYYYKTATDLVRVQYLGYCAVDDTKVVICRARQNRRKLNTPVKPFVFDNINDNIFRFTTNMINQNTWKKFLSEQNSYWHRRLFSDLTANNGSLPDTNLVTILTSSIPSDINTTYENWMDAGEIYYAGQNDLTRNVYWDHESQCYRYKENGDIVLAQMQKDNDGLWYFHNLYTDVVIIDKSMVLRRTAWKNENCTAQIYLIGGAGAFTANQTAQESSEYTTITGFSSFDVKAYSGGICVGGKVTGTYDEAYAGLYTANSGKDMPLSGNIRIPNTGNAGWISLSALKYGCSGTLSGSNILSISESKCCRPSGGVAYVEDILRKFIGKNLVIAKGTTGSINGKSDTGTNGAIVIVERWNA